MQQQRHVWLVPATISQAKKKFLLVLLVVQTNLVRIPVAQHVLFVLLDLAVEINKELLITRALLELHPDLVIQHAHRVKMAIIHQLASKLHALLAHLDTSVQIR